MQYIVSEDGVLVLRQDGWEWLVGQGSRYQAPPTYPVPIQPSGRSWDPRLTLRDVTLNPAKVAPGYLYWRLIRAEYRDTEQAQGKHHIYVDLLDEQGQRMVGQPLWAKWPDGGSTFFSEAKPGEEAAANFPMFAAGNPYRVSVAGAPSDEVVGMGLGGIEPHERHMALHVAYFLVFRLTRA